ncbi:TonB-dependent receptor [Mucilaginibacter corticis]|nr:TonB-dependent receptor [Mucilaginibacter corticis]
MKLTTLMLIVGLLHVSAKGIGQITIDESNVPVKKVLRSIEKQSGYHFFYDADQLKDQRIDVKVANATLAETLAQCFKNIPFTYSVLEKNVVIKQQATLAAERNNAAIMYADFHGTVRDEAGLPLPGVTVTNKSTKKAVTTDVTGMYHLSAQKGDVLVFSFVGYNTREITVADQATVDVSLTISVSKLNDVVVVGYGTTQRKDLTGAVATVSGKDIEDIPFTTFDNALAGKVAGVSVSKSDGSPGGAVRIRVRGSSSFLGGNDPLYVIDGVPLQATSNFQATGYDIKSPNANLANGANVLLNSSLSTSFVDGLNSLGGLNPDDIESITILKDASSTAIYGSKAANGVVLITTKKGKKNQKPQVNASYYSTVNSAVLPHLLNAEQFKTAYTQAAQNTAKNYTSAGATVPANVNKVLNSPSTFFGTANTNWPKLITQNAMSSNAEISVQGGSNSSSYFNSLSFNSTPGVVRSTGYQRIAGKINLVNDINSKFRIGTNLLLGYTGQDIGSNAYGQATLARPDYAPYDANGNYTDFSGIDPAQPSRIVNPLSLLNVYNYAKTFTLLGSLTASYDITSDLQFKSTVSTNVQMYNQRNYTPSYIGARGINGYSVTNGIGSNQTSTATKWLVENTLSYNKTFNPENNLNLVAGTSYESDKFSSFGAVGQGYPNDDVLTSLSSAVTPQSVNGLSPTIPQSYLLSFYVRANYSYLDKYILTFTGRADGSSKFGPDNKFGYFPSGGAAWRISQESFLKDVKWIDDIKIRGSYGLTGTQNIGDQMYRTLYSPSAYNGSSVLIPTQLGNSEVKWESTLQADGGIDISLFKGRLVATIDYYNKQTNNDLLSIPIASNTSYSTLLTNVGGLKNTGWEFALQGDIIRTKDFKWNAGFNITFDKSLVTKLDPDVSLAQIGNLSGVELANTTLIQGKPLGLITGLTETGIIRDQAQLDAYKTALGPYKNYFREVAIGGPMFKLLPNAGGYDYNTVIGHGAPKYWGGMNQSFSYKNFNLQLNFTYSVGGQLLWADHVASVEFYAPTNTSTSVLNAYTPDNTNASLPQLTIGAGYYKSTLDVFSSSFLTLRSLRLNYTFDKARWAQRVGFKNFGLFATATNVFTITKYPGNDPEISDDPYSLAGGYIDVSNYPTIRTYSLGIKAGF